MKKQKAKLLLLLSILFFYGCSGNLSRGKAEDMIKQNYQLPKDQIKPFTVLDGTFGMGQTKYIFEKLKNEGMLTYEESPGQDGCIGCADVHATLTDKGKQYATSEKYKTDNMYIYVVDVKVAKIEFGEIKGIQIFKENNSALVSYTLVRKNVTPFGRVGFNMQEGIINKDATFIKYDDGWRMQANNSNNYRIDDF